MLGRIGARALLATLLVCGVTYGARAQQPTSYGQAVASPSGWSFNVAPYLWTPALNTSLNLKLPPAVGGTASVGSSLGFGDLLSHLNFAGMVAADAQYDRFSVLTDLIYLNLGATDSHFRAINVDGLPSNPVSSSVQTSAGLSLNSTIWTLAGGYTLLQGDWGNLDLIGGFRYLNINNTFDYNLALTITGPRNQATFGGSGQLKGSANIWNGIGGLRGRIRIGDTPLFIPYYFDAGAGDSQLTWQIASGFGYHASWGDASITYRYMSFEQGSNAVVHHLWINGPQFAATFHF